jgi:hypothetical protein
MVGSLPRRSSLRLGVALASFSSRLCQSIASWNAVTSRSVRRDFRAFLPSMNVSA